MRPQDKPLPPKLETDRQIQRITISPERNPPAETSLGRLNCNWQIAGGSVWTNLGDKNSREAQSEGLRHIFMSFNSWSSNWFTVRTCELREKSLWVSSRRRGEVTTCEIQERTLSLTRPTLRRNLYLFGFFQSLNHLKEGKWNSSTLWPSVLRGWNKYAEKHLRSLQLRSTGSPKDWDLITGLQNVSPPSTAYHYTIKSLLTAVLFM